MFLKVCFILVTLQKSLYCLFHLYFKLPMLTDLYSLSLCSYFSVSSLSHYCLDCHSFTDPLWFFHPSFSFLLFLLCLSLLGSILTPLNARALINQCRVALFHRDPKQLVSCPTCRCMPVCCPSRCTSVCLGTWHARMHVGPFWDPAGKQDVRVRKVWMGVHGGFVSYWFAWTLHCIQQYTVGNTQKTGLETGWLTD